MRGGNEASGEGRRPQAAGGGLLWEGGGQHP